MSREDFAAALGRLGERGKSFNQQEQGLSLLAGSCIIGGGASAVAGLAVALLASLVQSDVLDVFARGVLSLIAPAGALLLIVRARMALCRRRYENQSQLQQESLPFAEPQAWEVLALVVSYAILFRVLT